MAKIDAVKQLRETIATRDLDRVRGVLEVDVDAARHPSAILSAAGSGWLDAIQLLAAAGADLNASWKNYRPLHALIQEKPHDAQGGTPARLACLRWLLAHGANPELRGAWPASRALLVATWVGERDYVDALLEAGAVRDGLVEAALGAKAAVKKAAANDAGFLHARDGDGGLTALHCACASRLSNTETARVLLDAGADPRATARSWGHDIDAAYLAIGSSQSATLELLLERGADATSALTSAAWKDDPRFREIALARGARMNEAVSGGRPLLNDLIRWGQFKQALWLLGRGASPDVADGEGWTAMHQAASRGNQRMMQALLDAGGDASRKDHKGFTPLALAVLGKKPKIIDLLSSRN